MRCLCSISPAIGSSSPWPWPCIGEGQACPLSQKSSANHKNPLLTTKNQHQKIPLWTINIKLKHIAHTPIVQNEEPVFTWEYKSCCEKQQKDHHKTSKWSKNYAHIHFFKCLIHSNTFWLNFNHNNTSFSWAVLILINEHIRKMVLVYICDDR